MKNTSAQDSGTYECQVIITDQMIRVEISVILGRSNDPYQHRQFSLIMIITIFMTIIAAHHDHHYILIMPHAFPIQVNLANFSFDFEVNTEPKMNRKFHLTVKGGSTSSPQMLNKVFFYMNMRLIIVVKMMIVDADD